MMGVVEAKQNIERFERKLGRPICLMNKDYVQLCLIHAKCNYLLGEVFDKKLDYRQALNSFKLAKRIV